jgi:hypothetical protein
MTDDLEQLRRQFLGWEFGTTWISAASGPEARRIYAAKDGRLLTAWSAAELAVEIRREETSGQQRGSRPKAK